MKKITLSALAALTIALSITSCKKGEEDPGFTILSRKARVTGEWKVTSLETASERTSINYYNGNIARTPYTTTRSVTHDGATYSSTYVSPNSVTNTNETSTGTGSVAAHTYTFKKDATWESNYSYTETVVTPYANFTQTTKTTFSQIESGVWDFTSGVGKENKSKESILVSVTSSKTVRLVVIDITAGSNTTSQSDTYTDEYTYAANEKSFVWNLVMLKNKEIKAEASFENTYKGDVSSVNSGGTPFLNVNTSVEETGSNKIVLTR
ncbi:MAG: hypothetical protein V4667_05595 [Bacteroidota bacterium]